jgi:hypothetical protein
MGRRTPRPMPDPCPIGRWYRWGRGRLERWDWCRRCVSTERVTRLDLGQDWTVPLSFLVARGVHPYAGGDRSEAIAAARVQRLTDQAYTQA